MSKSKRRPGYWAGILGTAMLLLSIFGISYGWTTVLIGQELQAIALELERNRIFLSFGIMFHAMTVGILEISGIETAVEAKNLLDLMPSPDFLVWVGYTRMGLAFAGIIIGIALAGQARWSIPAGAIWSLISIGWFICSTWLSWSLLNQSVDHPVTGLNSPIYLLNASVHLVWPIFLAVWLFLAWFRGTSRVWKL